MMKTYLVCDSAVDDSELIRATSPIAAARTYANSEYRTTTGDDEPSPDGCAFARLSVWSDEDTCELVAFVIADGRGGVREVCNSLVHSEAPHA